MRCCWLRCSSPRHGAFGHLWYELLDETQVLGAVIVGSEATVFELSLYVGAALTACLLAGWTWTLQKAAGFVLRDERRLAAAGLLAMATGLSVRLAYAIRGTYDELSAEWNPLWWPGYVIETVVPFLLLTTLLPAATACSSVLLRGVYGGSSVDRE